VVETATDIGGKVELGPPKTDAGRRAVPIVVPEVIEELDRRIKERGRRPEAWLWPLPSGGVLPTGRFRRRFWAPAVKAAGIDGKLVPHELRHTALTLWRMAGVPVEVAARWLGHRDMRVVLEIYSHLGELDGVDEPVLAQLRTMAARPTNPAMSQE
jgi:integrase